MDTATTYNIPTIATVTQQQVDDLLCTAFEGGITYWCDSADVIGSFPEGAAYTHETLTRGASIALHDSEGEANYILYIEDFLKGIGMAANHWKQDIVTFLEDHDADSADSAVQFAIFGELVYG